MLDIKVKKKVDVTEFVNNFKLLFNKLQSGHHVFTFYNTITKEWVYLLRHADNSFKAISVNQTKETGANTVEDITDIVSFVWKNRKHINNNISEDVTIHQFCSSDLTYY
ncbi:hypothetical protein ANTHOS_273 [Bacillus phage Anthos]|uniref:Uncharacterized protein n=2 Tax=Caudoviricetes TaxID=2731619 RepID=A0A7U3TT17_9CAUD|nr:hypothetical protein ANTHOS_273 [Bacillus phage Anthos]